MDENATPNSAPVSSNKTYLYVGAAVLILLVGGLGYAFKHQIKETFMGGAAQTSVETPPAVSTPTTSPAVDSSTTGAQVQGPVEVDYNDSGFSPATVSVKKGGTVKFVNKSSVQMDVASNPHPTHTDYPGFDQGKSSSRGQAEFTFTFDKVGTWGYHNHLNSDDGGTVVVTE